jgi:hypothetical protein
MILNCEYCIRASIIERENDFLTRKNWFRLRRQCSAAMCDPALASATSEPTPIGQHTSDIIFRGFVFDDILDSGTRTKTKKTARQFPFFFFFLLL